MARTLATLPSGGRITDYTSLGMIREAIPRQRIEAVLVESGKASIRQRFLPSYVVSYVIALTLFMQSSYREVPRCLLEGVQWLRDPEDGIRAVGKSGISQARIRLGAEPLRCLMTRSRFPSG